MGFEILEEGLFTSNEDKEFQIGMTSIKLRTEQERRWERVET